MTIHQSIGALLATLDSRTPYTSVDSLSGSNFERVTLAGTPMILKYVCVDNDWIMRACGDLSCRQLSLLESGLLDRLPAEIDNPTVAAAPFRSAHGHRGATILMRDVSAAMIAPGGEVVDAATHLRFLDHMAAMHAAYWAWTDTGNLLPLAHHYAFLTPTMAAIEAERGSTDPVPRALLEGWTALRSLDPDTAAILEALAANPSPLTSAMQAGPHTLVHGDWKLGNLGVGESGVTILLDWDRCGEAPPTIDLAWYLAVNCDRMPMSKEDAIHAYRSSLEQRDIDTSAWWDRQLALALLGAFLQLGWSKTADADEFAWWQAHVAGGVAAMER